METMGRHAIVVGGGMGGLFGATVLSRSFDKVTVIDRDSEPGWAEPRKSVPQGHHFHALLPGGLEAMEQWFPGFTSDLVEVGSVSFRAGRDFTAWMKEGRSYSLQSYLPNPYDGDLMFTQTRPLLEACVRRRVAGLGNVEFRFDTVAEGPSVIGGRVVGVRLADGTGMDSELVLDASGRAGLSARWVEAMGYGTVPEAQVNCGTRYATALVTPHDWDALDGVCTFVLPSGEGEHGSRSGAVVKADHGRWLVSLGGRYGDAPPDNWQGFVEFGATLAWPVWSDLVATVIPTDEIHTYALPRAIRRHFEQLDAFPDGLLPIGDSICFFNPTYGQGMSSAAQQCKALEATLVERAASGRGIEGLAHEVFPSMVEWIRGVWAIAAVQDFMDPRCTGDFPSEALADLQMLGQAVVDPVHHELVSDIVMLRSPLSAIRVLAAVAGQAS